ncbi:sugar transferase [Alcanivorax sp.]|uniref:sugar transferase n=1 Tax=Alcanivorax sp. TaxID=1872427 RepID=UPI0025BFFE32|nr:sugar transferase [Alcanivorax sp.]
MNSHYIPIDPARHTRLHERLLLNPVIGHLAGLIITLVGAQLIAHGSVLIPQDPNQQLSLITLTTIYIINALLLKKIVRFPGGRNFSYSASITLALIASAMMIILAFRLGYSRSTLFTGFAMLIGVQFANFIINRRYRKLKFALLPGVEITNKDGAENICFRELTSAELSDTRYDALVVNTDNEIEDGWLRYVAHHSASGTTIISSKALNEAINGKVDLNMLSIHDMDSLQPSAVYVIAKRLIDILSVILLSPIVLPVSLILALIIRFESKGPVLFVQERVGQKNTPFRMYKFRSMVPEDDDTPRFADMDKHRITRFGSFIRKFRLDELPQFLNVLKGDMSLIGPRPEQAGFVQKFEQEVPFYSYRHIVRPGITGWAQVSQGYAVCTESTREKVEHDFFYIKNLSLWMDILIVQKTIKTIVTGFGAK